MSVASTTGKKKDFNLLPRWRTYLVCVPVKLLERSSARVHCSEVDWKLPQKVGRSRHVYPIAHPGEQLNFTAAYCVTSHFKV